jgi:hypothetical protein
MLRPFPAIALFKPAPLRKRLWQAGIAMALLIFTIAGTNMVLSPQRRVAPEMLGHDFLPFYTAGQLVRNDCADLLYDLGAIKSIEREIAEKDGLDIGKSFGPFWNPPWYAWMFVTLSKLPYREALLCWTLLNVAALCVAILLMLRMLPRDLDWRSVLLVPLLIFVSMPFVQAISHGQNTFTSLMILAMIVTAWRQRKALIGGVCCGLLLYKPQLAVVLAIVMALDLGPRVLLGMGTVAATLVLVTGWLMPGALGDYLVKLPANLHVMQIENAYLWERHVTLRAFWRLLLQGRGPGEASRVVTVLTAACAFACAAGLLIARFRGINGPRTNATDNPWTGESTSRRRDRLIAATIAATPLLMPFYFDYDLLLLAVPAVLLAAEFNSRPIGAQLCRRDRWLLGTWCAMALWMVVNPGLANVTRVNGTVILLSTITTLLISRAIEREALEAVVETRHVEVARHRAAA